MNALNRSGNEAASPTRMIAIALTILLLGNLTVARGQERSGRPPVSWVNPDIAAMPGLSHHVLASESLGHDVGYVVATPEGYDDSGETRYPVVYFLHGMGGSEKSDAAGFTGRVRNAVRDGVMPPVICVFPNGGRSGYRGEVESMIVDELIPLIDNRYPTRKSTGTRLVAGFSMGGAGAIRLSLLHPEQFGAAGSWGGGMWRGADKLLAAAKQHSKTLKQNGFTALLINGDRDRPDAFEPLAKEFKQLGISHELVVLDDTPHNLGLYYERSGDRMMRFLGERLKSRN